MIGPSTPQQPYLPIPIETLVEQTNDPISWLDKAVKWLRADDEKEPLFVVVKNVLAISLAILLFVSIIGIPVLYYGCGLWHDLKDNGISPNSINPVNPTIIKPSVTDPISQSLIRFNNSKVKGQVNGIYITTNEINLVGTAQVLKERPKPTEKQTIHIGCAAWHNLDIMCLRKSDYGLIVDFNPKNKDFITKTIDIIKQSDSREKFKQSMVDYLNSLKGKERDTFFHQDQRSLPIESIEIELTREGSWLKNDENYLFIKELVSKDRLAAITEDITNSKTFLEIREHLDKNNIFIDTVYLSNISNFMKTAENQDSFAKSVKSLLADDTILINCPKVIVSSSRTIILHQKPLLGREVLDDTYNTKHLFEESNNLI